MEFFKLSSPKLYIAGMLMLFLCGCSIFHPYIDRRRNPGVSDVRFLYSGPSKPSMPVICYNPLITDDDELQQMAVDECIKNETGDRAVFLKKTYLSGKLLLPSHAYYQCVKNGEEPPTQEPINQDTDTNETEDEITEDEYNEFTVGK